MRQPAKDVGPKGKGPSQGTPLVLSSPCSHAMTANARQLQHSTRQLPFCGSQPLVTTRSVHSLECACLTRRKRPPSSCLPYHVSSHCFGLGFLGKHVFAHSTSFPASSCCFLPLSYGPRGVPNLSCSIMCNTRINHRISGILGLPTRNHPLLKKYIRQCHRLAASQLHMPDPTYDMST